MENDDYCKNLLINYFDGFIDDSEFEMELALGFLNGMNEDERNKNVDQINKIIDAHSTSPMAVEHWLLHGFAGISFAEFMTSIETKET